MRTAIITGAGSGIGRAIAVRLAADGYNVVVNDFRAEAADQVAREIGAKAISVQGDVSSEADVARIERGSTRCLRLEAFRLPLPLSPIC